MLDFYNIAEKAPVAVTSFFNHVMVWNRGVSFGMFQQYENSNLFFSIFSTIVILILLFLSARSKDKIESSLLAVIAGGAIGNVIDRLRLGAVADFFDFHYDGYHWPAFNIADSFISVGAVSLIIYSLFFQQHEKQDSNNEGKENDEKN
jgi:signal peptidase II